MKIIYTMTFRSRFS